MSDFWSWIGGGALVSFLSGFALKSAHAPVPKIAKNGSGGFLEPQLIQNDLKTGFFCAWRCLTAISLILGWFQLVNLPRITSACSSQHTGTLRCPLNLATNATGASQTAQVVI